MKWIKKWYKWLQPEDKALLQFITVISICGTIVYILSRQVSSNALAPVRPILSLVSVSMLVFLILLLTSKKR